MTLASNKLIAAKEFALMPNPPDGSKQELVRGMVVTMPPLTFSRGLCKANVGFALLTYAKTTMRGRAVFSTGIITGTDPDTVRGPDVMYWSFERLPIEQTPKGYPEVVPDLCVEILSSERQHGSNDKIREYFTSGAKMVWIVDPEERTVTVYRRPGDGRILWDDATLTGEEVLPGFSCAVADLFAR
jgi:Uma2 family endonuclease